MTFILLTLALLLTSASPAAQRREAITPLAPQELARTWDAEHVSPQAPPLMTHEDVVERLKAVVAATPDMFSMEQLGRSVEGRSIHHLRVGSG
ncbi:MAG: hypothetical protein M3541_07360, partial [Acidobacteriota bacterium]|nr:hypothetical protein [Acidobacteriota bacterium]